MYQQTWGGGCTRKQTIWGGGCTSKQTICIAELRSLNRHTPDLYEGRSRNFRNCAVFFLKLLSYRVGQKTGYRNVIITYPIYVLKMGKF